ncbi:luciferin 4-monooxygenase-like protein [Leptotrombidium deliense]|uniref:Luciferin 4-monooxygenase-like protein n=1 Tax=Leptotrombidium deliense TaxID=299467 RepID=A0A443SC94_9ACAR|nr:luciferin 4-monooxygenase-like protein [Leptotrombidium deliense]
MDPNKFVRVEEKVLISNSNVLFEYNSFAKAVIEKLSANMDKIAMIDAESGKHWTAEEMISAIIKLGSAFITHGVSKGDVVFFYCLNNDIHTVAMLAIWCISAVYSGSVQDNPEREVQNLIRISNAQYLVGYNENLNICLKLKEQFKQIRVTTHDQNNLIICFV